MAAQIQPSPFSEDQIEPSPAEAASLAEREAEEKAGKLPRDKEELRTSLHKRIRIPQLLRSSHQANSAQALTQLRNPSPCQLKAYKARRSLLRKIIKAIKIPPSISRQSKEAQKKYIYQQACKNSSEITSLIVSLISDPNHQLIDEFSEIQPLLDCLKPAQIITIVEEVIKKLPSRSNSKKRLLALHIIRFLQHLNPEQLSNSSQKIFELVQSCGSIAFAFELVLVAFFREREIEIPASSRFAQLEPDTLFDSPPFQKEIMEKDNGETLSSLFYMVNAIQNYDEYLQAFSEDTSFLTYLPWFHGNVREWICEFIPFFICQSLSERNLKIAEKLCVVLHNYCRDYFLRNSRPDIPQNKALRPSQEEFTQGYAKLFVEAETVALAIRHNILVFFETFCEPSCFNLHWNTLKEEGFFKANLDQASFKKMLNVFYITYQQRPEKFTSFPEKTKQMFTEALDLQKGDLAAACLSLLPEILEQEERLEHLNQALEQSIYPLALELMNPENPPPQPLDSESLMSRIIHQKNFDPKQKQRLLLQLFSLCKKHDFGLPDPSPHYAELEELKLHFGNLLIAQHQKHQKEKAEDALSPQERKAQRQAKKQARLEAEAQRREATFAQLQADLDRQTQAQQKRAQEVEARAKRDEQAKTRKKRLDQRAQRFSKFSQQTSTPTTAASSSSTPSSSGPEVKTSESPQSPSLRHQSLVDWAKQQVAGEERGILKWQGEAYKVTLDTTKLEGFPQTKQFISTFQSWVAFQYQASSDSLKARPIQGNVSQGIKPEGHIICIEGQPMLVNDDVVRRNPRAGEQSLQAFAIKLKSTPLRVVGVIDGKHLRFCTTPIQMEH